ncbi:MULTISPECIES: ABC transporter substrate-binding protein [Rhodopseudomonas]|uniref:ABC transporter substrate-binding protein n=1 Tax=Rhodopseudomonas palustris TaxID=1076 RepID=A0A0D7EPE0_RHOPL|nr:MULTISPECIES: ABC transporter substrate-binding protein [Rhodopseudomonas]KIZ42663.1 ABC transporter substrate-binding protein [Rhodopseudomonas palustris]MDF3812979.1 ABC transporter substrate-binding protein [Rhodopseudomonas sp. BAL398]WOK17497.1 ABC transporter substrate-binding protein [Rhodopseudomonas sp. BAL398]
MFHNSRWLGSTIASKFGLPALALAAALSLPATMAEAKTIHAVMHSNLRVIDPGLTTAYITRDHGYMVYDTLLSMNSKFEVKPQMADWKVSDDKLTYTFTLRDGLKWHDGKPVTAEDCVASLQRWGQRDGMGQKLMSVTASLVATDAKTITLTLKEPYGLVLESIGKPSSLVPFMYPKRIAETPADKAIPEQIGSGPFKFVQAEFQPGVKAVYVKNTDYVPRKEAPDWTSGGKVVKVDRVEWITMTDAQTAINALQSGDIDFLEVPSYDMLPVLAQDPELKIEILNKLGSQTIGRMNFLYPPFDNVKVRRAALLAMNQKPVLDAMIGNPEYYKLCGAMFGCGTPLETDVGSAPVLTGDDMAEAKKELAASGYDGTPVVLMAPTDVAALKTQPVVAAQLLREAGFKVDLQATDWQTVVSRRASQKPPSEGGWNLFFTTWVAPDIMNPVANVMLSGKGKSGGWFGWPTDAKMDEMIDQYARATAPDAQKKIATDIQARAYEQVTYMPLGAFTAPAVWRKTLTGVLDGPATPVFWNMEKSED